MIHHFGYGKIHSISMSIFVHVITVISGRTHRFRVGAQKIDEGRKYGMHWRHTSSYKHRVTNQWEGQANWEPQKLIVREEIPFLHRTFLYHLLLGQHHGWQYIFTSKIFIRPRNYFTSLNSDASFKEAWTLNHMGLSLEVWRGCKAKIQNLVN